MKFPTLDGLFDAEMSGKTNNQTKQEMPIGNGFINEKVEVKREEPGDERVESIFHEVDFAPDGDLILFSGLIGHL